MKKLTVLMCLVLVGSFLSSTAFALVYPITELEQMEEAHLTENRTYAAMPTIEATGERLWVAWVSGGNTEPHDDNYIVVGYSDDQGVSWQEPYMILDPGALGRSYNPVFWQDPTGRLWLFFGENGAWSMYTDNPCDVPEYIIWSTPKKIGSNLITQKPIAITRDGVETYLLPGQASASKTTTQLFSATPGAEQWKLVKKSYFKSTNKHNHWMEAMIVEKLDGSLWALSRIESGYNGGVEQAFSYDDGKTWTTLEGDLPYPLQGPGSRFQIYRLSSGALIWISHDTTKARTALTAWLSEDDGETWPYKLLLDDRANLSYPDITQDDNGLICVIYDKGRSKEQEIRLAMFTEDDVRAGAFVTENALERVAVTKTGGYTDILYFEEQFDQTYSVADQRELDALLAKLPTTLHGMTDTDDEVVLVGEWQVIHIDELGAEVKLKTTLPSKTQDLYSLLEIKVWWKE